MTYPMIILVSLLVLSWLLSGIWGIFYDWSRIWDLTVSDALLLGFFGAIGGWIIFFIVILNVGPHSSGGVMNRIVIKRRNQ